MYIIRIICKIIIIIIRALIFNKLSKKEEKKMTHAHKYSSYILITDKICGGKKTCILCT